MFITFVFIYIHDKHIGFSFYIGMSKIYQQGIPPVQVDESKASWYKGMSMQ